MRIRNFSLLLPFYWWNFINEVIYFGGFQFPEVRRRKKKIVKTFRIFFNKKFNVYRHQYRMLLKDLYFISGLLSNLAKSS
jgi:hypothetical protein